MSEPKHIEYGSAASKVLVAVATYKRPDGLAALLRSLEASVVSRLFTVFVVDNDASGSGKAVAEASTMDLRYVVEPQPGIAAARNRALDEFPNFDAIIFVDDDEYVEPTWLETMLDRADETDADVLIGPVRSVFPDDAPRWVVRGGFIQRPVWSDGERLTAGATNNTLMKRVAWEHGGSPRFDESFSATGGSDAKLFSLLLAKGITITFVRDAVVHEPVPPSRMTVKWLIRRAYRNGIVSARIWVLKHGNLKTFARGAIMSGTGVVGFLRDIVTGRGIQAGAFNDFFTGLGVMSSLTGVRIHEYARPDVKKS